MPSSDDDGSEQNKDDEDDSDGNPTDEEVNKAQEEVQQHPHKKRKADKSANTVSLAQDDISLLCDAIAEVAKSSLKGVSKKQLQLTSELAEHVNQLIEAINKVKATFKAETYGVDPSIP